MGLLNQLLDAFHRAVLGFNRHSIPLKEPMEKVKEQMEKDFESEILIARTGSDSAFTAFFLKPVFIGDRDSKRLKEIIGSGDTENKALQDLHKKLLDRNMAYTVESSDPQNKLSLILKEYVKMEGRFHTNPKSVIYYNGAHHIKRNGKAFAVLEGHAHDEMTALLQRMQSQKQGSGPTVDH